MGTIIAATVLWGWYSRTGTIPRSVVALRVYPGGPVLRKPPGGTCPQVSRRNIRKRVSDSSRQARVPSAPPRKIIILGGGVVLFEIRLVGSKQSLRCVVNKSHEKFGVGWGGSIIQEQPRNHQIILSPFWLKDDIW